MIDCSMSGEIHDRLDRVDPRRSNVEREATWFESPRGSSLVSLRDVDSRATRVSNEDEIQSVMVNELIRQ